MSPFLIDSIGYGALVINLYSTSTKDEYKLRLISLIANLGCIFYGVLISASPIIIGLQLLYFYMAITYEDY